MIEAEDFTIKELIRILETYPSDWHVSFGEESTGSQRNAGSLYTYDVNYATKWLHIIRDIDGT